MKYITNKYQSINYPYDPELLEWLRENYPYSNYHVVELETV